MVPFFQLLNLLVESASEPVSLVSSSKSIHSSRYGQFACHSSSDLSPQPFWRLMDCRVLEYYPVLGWTRASLEGSEEGLLRSENLKCAGRHLGHTV